MTSEKKAIIDWNFKKMKSDDPFKYCTVVQGTICPVLQSFFGYAILGQNQGLRSQLICDNCNSGYNYVSVIILGCEPHP